MTEETEAQRIERKARALYEHDCTRFNRARKWDDLPEGHKEIERARVRAVEVA